MIRTSIIGLLKRAIMFLEGTLEEKPKARPFQLAHDDLDLIHRFLASPQLSEKDRLRD